MDSWKKRAFFSRRYIPQERRRALILACIFLWSIIAFFAIRHYLVGTVVVQGESMAPTLLDGDRRVVHRWIYLVKRPGRGDIVVLKDPTDGTLSVKRVIALPNEILQIRDKRVFVGGRPLEEPYLASAAETDPRYLAENIYAVGGDHYFVLGDNRPESADSRFFGAISRRDVLGRILEPSLRKVSARKAAPKEV